MNTLIVFLLVSAATCASAQDDGTKTIIDVAAENGNFTTLLSALDTAGLTDTLRGEGPFTVFAPTDEAFKALPNETIGALLNDTEALKKVLLYHALSGKVMAADVANTTNVTTLQGSSIPVNITEQGVFIGNVKVVATDVEASNGVIHIIDAVLIPPEEATPEEPVQEKDIIETARAEGNFTTLLTAIDAAQLTATLKGEGPFTVFAPKDEAFAALPNGTIEALLNDTEALKRILLYHVVSGKLMSEDVVNVTNITTLQGKRLNITLRGDRAFLGDSEIILQDVNATNGVIHVIDSVLIPPEDEPAKWYFFSIPFQAENNSAENLLAGIQYNALLYYNSSSKTFENASTIEPLKGYWINVPGGVEFSASRQFASAKEVSSAASIPPGLKLYPGWNAVGSPSKLNMTADTVFISIADSYSKVKGPWRSDEKGSGNFTFVGYNGLTGTLSGNQVGTDVFSVRPYEGYWVYMKEEGTLA